MLRHILLFRKVPKILAPYRRRQPQEQTHTNTKIIRRDEIKMMVVVRCEGDKKEEEDEYTLVVLRKVCFRYILCPFIPLFFLVVRLFASLFYIKYLPIIFLFETPQYA